MLVNNGILYKNMAGKTVLVTGSSRGIGLAVAGAFLVYGCNVAINSRSGEDLEKALSELLSISGNVAGFPCDVSDYNSVSMMFEDIRSRFGEVDILVNNAGVALYGLFQEQGQEDWEKCIDINLKSVLNCSRLAVPSMIKRKEGKIINISSIWGEQGASCEAVYSAAKGAVNSFTKALAKELAPSNISVNAIACGVIDTKMNSHLSPDEHKELIEQIPIGRMGNPFEIADCALFLAFAPAYLTGQILTVSGGM